MIKNQEFMARVSSTKSKVKETIRSGEQDWKNKMGNKTHLSTELKKSSWVNLKSKQSHCTKGHLNETYSILLQYFTILVGMPSQLQNTKIQLAVNYLLTLNIWLPSDTGPHCQILRKILENNEVTSCKENQMPTKAML